VHALTFVMIAAYTGMRQAPVLNLRARDIDCDRRVMWIGKEKAVQREQPIPKGLADYLRPLLRTMEPAPTCSHRARRRRQALPGQRDLRAVREAGEPSSAHHAAHDAPNDGEHGCTRGT
jgi:integrase